MTFVKLMNCVMYGQIPPRPQNISEVRWDAMVRHCVKELDNLAELLEKKNG